MGFIKSSAIVSLGTLCSRILGFIRDILIARYLGAGISSDVFFIALRIPNTFRQIFGEGAFNMAFVPLFKKYCDTNDVNPKALKFLEQTFTLFMLAILIILIVCEIFMPQIINSLAPSLKTKGADVFNLAVNTSRIVMPYILFVSYMTFMGAVLNSLGKFAAMAFAPAMVNVGYIIAFIVYAIFNLQNANITYIASAGFVFGGFLQFLVMYLTIKKMPFTIKFTKPVLSKEVKLLFVKFIPTMLGSGIVILNSLVSVFLASGLQEGSVSYLFYADRLVQLPVALFGTAIATVLLPTLTQRLKEGADISIVFMKVFSVTLVISAFCELFFLNNAPIIVSTLFERGAFNQSATLSTALALHFMALAIPGIMGLKILNTIFYAKGNTKTPTIIAFFSFILNLVLCLILMQKLSYIGLVLAGVIAVYFTVLVQFTIILFKKVIKFIDIFKAFSYFIIIGLVLQFIQIFLNYFILNIWQININNGILEKVLYLGILGSVGLAATLGFIWLFKLHKKV